MEIFNTCSILKSRFLDKKRKYLEGVIIVLDDNFNTFQYVANCLEVIIPKMSRENPDKSSSKLIVKFRQKYGEDLLNKQTSIIRNR